VYLEQTAARAKQMEEYLKQFQEVCFLLFAYIQKFIKRMIIDMFSLNAGGLS
jgi:hypothetical protein